MQREPHFNDFSNLRHLCIKVRAGPLGIKARRSPLKMRRLYIIGAVGLLLSIATAVFCLHFARDNAQSAKSFVANETFKVLLTFTLVALGGALIKGAVDASLDEQRAHRARSE